MKLRPIIHLNILALFLLPSGLLAQRGGGPRGGGMHGAGFRGGFAGGSIGGFHGGVGAFRGGFVSHGGFGRGSVIFPRAPSFRRPFFPGRRAFFGYPRYGFSLTFGYGYWPAYTYWPPSYVYYPPPLYPVYYAPPVYPVAPPEQNYEADEGTRSRDHYWLIAMRDQTILAVTDYWLEDSTLHYVSRQGVKSSVELADVELDFTKELNRERGLEFRLPRPNEYHPQRRDSHGRPY